MTRRVIWQCRCGRALRCEDPTFQSRSVFCERCTTAYVVCMGRHGGVVVQHVDGEVVK